MKNPRPVEGEGSNSVVRFADLNTANSTLSPIDHQVLRLMADFGLTAATASAVASLAFNTGARP